MITVTKTYLPPLEEYAGYLQKIWESNWITNNGPMVVELENRLKKYFGVRHLFLVTNGTIALQIAAKSLGIQKEIITTPFSYVASTSSVVWEGCRPKFVDIDPETLCIDPGKIEEAITPDTEAILAVHVYGNPCDTERIEAIARKRGLKVIYDAAHAFGVEYRGRSIMTYGDISTVSFHATKIFHTTEGGAVITDNDAVASTIAAMRNFGQSAPDQFTGLGINGKLSELHAAMGLCVLPKVPFFIERRKQASDLYTELFRGTCLRRLRIAPDTKYNFPYYPVIFPSEDVVLRVIERLRSNAIYPRRYFYPALNLLPYVEPARLPAAEDIAKRILCLPLHHELEPDQVRLIAGLVMGELK